MFCIVLLSRLFSSLEVFYCYENKLVGFKMKDIYLVLVSSALVKVTIRRLILSFQCQLAITFE
jgi:hypothetical protein